LWLTSFENVLVSPLRRRNAALHLLSSQSSDLRPLTPEETEVVMRERPELAAMASDDVAEVVAACERERAAYRAALEALERERRTLAAKLARVKDLEKPLAEAARLRSELAADFAGD